MARPTLLNDERRGEIVKAIKVGATIEVAAQAAGVHVDTLCNWLGRGSDADEEERTGGKVQDGETPYLEFFLAVTRARAGYEVELLSEIRHADVGGDDELRPDVKARQWLLERTRPERYAMKIEIVAREQAARHLLAHLRERLPPEVFALVVQALSSDEPAQESEHTEH